jgi:hypothetical protein
MIFFVSPQRGGTKSFGDLMKSANQRVWSWQDTRESKIESLFLKRRFHMVAEILLESGKEVFEDYPFFHPEFLKFAFFNFEDSKFVYLERNSKDWFTSLLTHSKGKSLGHDLTHADLYDRWDMLATTYRFGKQSSRNSLDIRFAQEIYVSWHRRHRDFVANFFECNRNSERLYFNSWKSLDILDLSKFLQVEIKPVESMIKHSTKDKTDKLRRMFS